MTASKEERFSALQDGEVSDFEKRRLVDELLKDEDAQRQWMRSHLIGDAMRGELPETISMDFAAAIRDKIDQEEEINVSHSSGPQWFKPAAGFSVAAMVAVVSVLSLQSMVGYDQGASPVPTVVSTATPPVSADNANVQLASTPVSPAQEDVSSEEVQQRINRYLINHSEYASRPGVLPHARIVGYEQAGQ
ncbi:MAG: sigma-E factor negative regulatory protein [Gammaproteobacteria bacterium]|nr:sigma-E factor negative regulatory protein [Gammaproteobacteria bacterium]